MKSSNPADYCRTCLAIIPGRNTHTIYDSLPGCSKVNRSAEKTSEIFVLEFLCLFADVTVKINEHMPQNMCDQCFDKIVDFYKFKEKCEQSEHSFRSGEFFLQDDELNDDFTDGNSTTMNYFKVEDEWQDSSTRLSIRTIEDKSMNLGIGEEGLVIKLEDPIRTAMKLKTIKSRKKIGKKPMIKKTKVSISKKKSEIEPPIDKSPLIATDFKPKRTIDIDHKCPICGMSFALQVNLKNHIARKHGDETPPGSNSTGRFKCDQCPVTFHSVEAKELHIERKKCVQILCSICGREFYRLGIYNVHMSTVHLKKRHKCTICDKEYPRMFHLRLHMRREHPDEYSGEDLRQYKCPHCPKIFYDTTPYRKHMRSHTGERPYKCFICGQGFIQNYGLKTHMKVHTNQKVKNGHGRRPTHKCPICSIQFSQLQLLKDHEKIHIEPEREMVEETMQPIAFQLEFI